MLLKCLRAHPRRPSVSHVSHQEPQQLGVVLVAAAHAVLIALPLVFLHHLDKTPQIVYYYKSDCGDEEHAHTANMFLMRASLPLITKVLQPEEHHKVSPLFI